MYRYLYIVIVVVERTVLAGPRGLWAPSLPHFLKKQQNNQDRTPGWDLAYRTSGISTWLVLRAQVEVPKSPLSLIGTYGLLSGYGPRSSLDLA